jgi:hypothetical protein
MATSRLLQRLAAGDGTSSNRRQVETFIVENPAGSGAPLSVPKGSVVAFDFSKSDAADKLQFVTAADKATATAKSVVGAVAADYTIEEGTYAKVEVIIAGSAEVIVPNGAAVGNSLTCGTAGAAAVYLNSDTTPIFATLAVANSSGAPALRLAVIHPQF